MANILNLATTDAKAFMERVFEEKDIVSDDNNDLDDFYYECDPGYDIEIDGVNFVVNSVYSEGGGEGEGEYVERVLSISHSGKILSYIRDTGFYASYDGTSMDCDYCFVEPQQVTVTRYAEPGKKANVR